jgi:hypothetical protein
MISASRQRAIVTPPVVIIGSHALATLYTAMFVESVKSDVVKPVIWLIGDHLANHDLMSAYYEPQIGPWFTPNEGLLRFVTKNTIAHSLTQLEKQVVANLTHIAKIPLVNDVCTPGILTTHYKIPVQAINDVYQKLEVNKRANVKDLMITNNSVSFTDTQPIVIRDALIIQFTDEPTNYQRRLFRLNLQSPKTNIQLSTPITLTLSHQQWHITAYTTTQDEQLQLSITNGFLLVIEGVSRSGVVEQFDLLASNIYYAITGELPTPLKISDNGLTITVDTTTIKWTSPMQNVISMFEQLYK